MLISEYNTLKRARHKNITKIEEIYQDSNQLVYVMEYLPGGELY